MGHINLTMLISNPYYMHDQGSLSYCRENICHVVKAPANVSSKIQKMATEVACKAVSSLEGAGVFAVELFLTEDDQVVI